MTMTHDCKTLTILNGKFGCRAGSKIVLTLWLGAFSWAASSQNSHAQDGWLLLDNATPKVTENANAGWSLPAKPVTVRNAAGREVLGKSQRPDVPLFAYGTVVTTGFSGVRTQEPYEYADGRTDPAARVALDFIDPNGAAANLLGVDRIGYSFNATEVTRPVYDEILARDVGQVFGIAIDENPYRNLYLTATSAFGLNVVGKDENNDRVLDRLLVGQKGANWMPAQWGNAPLAGPGSVWKVDGATGQISLFANIKMDAPNAGPGLGNIAFDRGHDQLFVSDLETGMVHRLDMDGRDLEHFDHGQSARTNANLSPVVFDPARRMDKTSADFDVEDTNTWGFADQKRRVWGLAARGGRLYYAVADGPQIWSVGLDQRDGSFLDDARWELDVSDAFPGFEISDLVFDGAGALVLAQRGDRRGDFTHDAFTKARRASVLRYVYEYPANPETPSAWVAEPQRYAVGFAHQQNNTTGGVDVGPAYTSDGRWDDLSCGGTLWSTGESLRQNRELRAQLELGGEQLVDGVQAQPVWIDAQNNTPPWLSYFADYDGEYPTDQRAGHIGDVEILGCVGGGGFAGPVGTADEVNDADNKGENDGDYTDDWDTPSCTRPGGCEPTPPKACVDTFVKPVCNTKTGTYEMITLFTDQTGVIDRLKLDDPTGALSPLPAEISVDDILTLKLANLAAGQPAQLNLCGFNARQRETGQPYDCCTVNLTITQPKVACEKEAN
jgi:hypothetical protein